MYKALSAYGLRAGRALGWLLGLVVMLTVPLMGFGLPDTTGPTQRMTCTLQPTRAASASRAADQLAREAVALSQGAWCVARLGDRDTARGHCETALALHRRHHNRECEASTLAGLCHIDHSTGHHHEAIHRYHQVLAL
ncbi:tetratricopeptide repeat protein [Saccharothrix xinjiangensis]|uniref:Tetratricopeptide repeat protein n=1 Tax=Saccharothrix xinjiangensis TaxID=204798 RepID=A0ABV9Y3K6_9PSEU